MMRSIIAALLLTLALAPAAQATSGPGCLVVRNVAEDDVLNLRSRPSPGSRVVGELAPGEHGVIHLDAPCGPASRPWAQRWCKVSVYDGESVLHGYVKARYVRDSDCP